MDGAISDDAAGASAPSVVHGAPLAEEQGLGALTLPGFLRETVGRHGPREALAWSAPNGRIERRSYDELWDESLVVAQALVAGGLGKGERVGVLMTNRAEFLTAMFGVSLAGGVATPLSTFSTTDELAHLLERSAISVLLFEPRVLKKDFRAILRALEPALDGERPGELRSLRFPFLRRLVMLDADAGAECVETWRDFLAGGTGIETDLILARVDAVAPADPGMLFFSSGSTGKPKGILSSQRGVAIQMWRMAPLQGLDERVRMWTANGFFWSGNFAMVVGGTLAAGGTIVLQPTFRPAEALSLLESERVDFLFAWPHQWQQLVDAPNWADVDLLAMRYIDVDSSSKGAIIALTRTLAAELGPLGVTVNNVPPGTVMNTVMSEAQREKMPDALNRTLAALPAGRQGEPEDIAHAVSWLVSEGAGYVTGQTIGVNGGRVPS